MENKQKLSFDIEYVKKDGNTANIKALLDNETIEIDKINLISSRSRSAFLRRVAKKSGFAFDEIDKALIDAISKSEQTKKNYKSKPVNPLDNTPEIIKQRAMEMLKSPDLMDIISQDIEKIGIAGETDLRKQLYIIMTSRILEKPLSGIAYGTSASGKSYMIETIAKLMPDEAVIRAHDITQEALYYLPENALVHKIIIAGERIEDKRTRSGKAEDNTKALREILASGKLTKMVTLKSVTGTPKTKIINQNGPIVYLESTTSTKIHDEDATRLLPLITDESANQTETIVRSIKEEAKGKVANTRLIEDVFQIHKTAQRLLKPLKVIIPYVDSLKLPLNVVSTRRVFNQFVSFIKSVALLRQYQKEIKKDDENEYIEADFMDYEISFHLVSKIFGRIYSPINQKSRELLLVIEEKTKDLAGNFDGFTIQKLTNWIGISEASVRRRLKELVFKGIIEEKKDSKPFTYKLEKPELAEYADIDLIRPEELEERLAIQEY